MVPNLAFWGPNTELPRRNAYDKNKMKLPLKMIYLNCKTSYTITKSLLCPQKASIQKGATEFQVKSKRHLWTLLIHQNNSAICDPSEPLWLFADHLYLYCPNHSLSRSTISLFSQNRLFPTHHHSLPSHNCKISLERPSYMFHIITRLKYTAFFWQFQSIIAFFIIA